MPDWLLNLLDGLIGCLQDFKAQGVRYVTVSPQTLEALRQPLPATAALAAPSPAPASAPAPQRPAALAPVPALADTPPLAPEARAQAMEQLRQRALGCVRCPHLAASRKQVVFGVGDVCAALMFVGEAPGAEEDEQGEPFVGAAGQLLTKIIQAMGLTRAQVYIANILKCRPDTPGQAFGNRPPTAAEMHSCLPYLEAQIALIRPRVLVALGATAVKGLLGTTVGITQLRGRWQSYNGIPLMPTFHPSFLLRPENAGKKRLVWADMLQVMEKLGLPITEKQRRYFTQAAAG